MTKEDEDPSSVQARDFELDVLAERRARRSELQGDAVLLRRAETAEESARDLEGRLAGIQDRLRDAERECATATERLAVREQELRLVSERLATREQDLRLLSERLVERERQLRDAEREIKERIEGLERRVGEFKRELASEREARLAAEAELGRLRSERQRVERLVVELKRVARRLRDMADIEKTSSPKIAAEPGVSAKDEPAPPTSAPKVVVEPEAAKEITAADIRPLAATPEPALAATPEPALAATPEPALAARPEPALVPAQPLAPHTNGTAATGAASGLQDVAVRESEQSQSKATQEQAKSTQGQAKGMHVTEALAAAVERLRARVAAVGELNERREAAPSAPLAAVPYVPPLPEGKQEVRGWLAPAIRQMSDHGGARLAAELIVELLPAQAQIVKGELRYLLRIEELGAFQIELSNGQATVRGVGNAEREEDAAFDPDFTLEGPAAAFAEFAGGGIQRRPKGLRMPGRRRRARRLFSARRKPLALTGLVEAGIQIWPGLLLAAFAEAVVPEWTGTNTFAVAFSIEGRQSAVLDVGVRAGLPLRVTRVQGERGSDQPEPAATVRLGEEAFLRLLSGQPLPEGEQVLVEGDLRSLEQLLSWTDRVQGLRRFAA